MTYRSQFLCGQILYTDLSFHILTDCLKKSHFYQWHHYCKIWRIQE